MDDARADVLPPAGDPMANRRLMDRIAELFDVSRSRPWPQVVRFVGQLVPGARLIDLAAGNGRHSLVAAEHGCFPIAVDVSRRLPRILVERAAVDGLVVEAVEGDALDLPFQDASFDAGLFIAGVHCIQGRDSRLRALRELRRVLSPDGVALVSVWSRSQDRFRDHFDAERHRHPLKVRAHQEEGRAGPPPEFGDIDIPWRHGLDEEVPRFFHLYALEEFLADLSEAGFALGPREEATLGRGERPDNYFVVVRPRTSD